MNQLNVSPSADDGLVRHVQHRAVHTVPLHMAAMEKAIKERDFLSFAQLTMQV